MAVMTPSPAPSPAATPERPDREALADVLLAAGPEAPTLCEGWLARDLAVHLLLRDGRPDVVLGALAGRAVPALGSAAARARAGIEALPWPELVQRVRSGPPAWSPARLGVVERALNTVEFFVHAEDVRRAAPGWTPSSPPPLRPGQREQLWRSLRTSARVFYRRSPVGVVLAVPSGPSAVAARGAGLVTVTGQPEELLLHAFGRRGVAQVEVTGPQEAVRAFESRFPAQG
jgi:uncharacterized protein (TIGR03085 family)